MKIKIWGARGSIPTPLDPTEIEEKICQAIYGLTDVDTSDMAAVKAYVAGLSPFIRSTVGGNTSCVEIQTRGETFIVDAGSGLRRLGLELMKGPCGRGQGKLHIFLTHLHWDHIQGFPFFVPAFIPGNHLVFYSIHDVETALADQQRYQFFPVAFNAEQAEREFKKLSEDQRQRYGYVPAMQARREFVRLEVGVPFSVGPLKINTIQNHHPGDAYSFRFEDQHSVFVYANDAEYKNLEDETTQVRLDFFRGADALIFDAQYGLRESWESKADFGHSSAMIGVDFARRAAVKKLLLAHHEPIYSDVQLQKIRETAIAYQAQDTSLPTCEVLLAYEGLQLDLTPAGTIEVQIIPERDAAVVTPTSIFDEQQVNLFIQQFSIISTPEDPTSSVIDLSQVEHLTTASLKALVNFNQQRKTDPVVLAAPSPAVETVIKLAGYGDYFAVYPTVEEATKAVQARQALKLPGQIINKQYQIADQLGEGRLGAVLKVMDLQKHQTAALKTLPLTLGVETIDRFASQVHLLLELDHPSIAHIYDCDWSQDGNYTFIVEELLTGPTLHERLGDQAERLTEDEALDITLNLTLALEYAHSRGVIHGNLRPEDIFLTPNGLKLSSFGLGRLEETRNLLEAPMLFLTASYLAPEQIQGKPLDARTDLYALGVILYQLFTGRLPFAGSEYEILQAHLEQLPIPPRQLNPNLSHSIEHLILKLLAKTPSDRYGSAKQARRIASGLMSSGSEGHLSGQNHLVGREHQLQRLRTCWTETQAGYGQLALITGEPGIGKTSLARQFAAQSRAEVVLIGRCQEGEGSPPYEPFREALQAYFATVPPELFNQEAQQLIANFTWLAPELRQIVPGLPDPPSLEPQQEQFRLISSLTQFIVQATQQRPWLLILDDLQWIDPSSLELLRYLGRHLPKTALFIIGSYRDTEVGRRHPLQALLRDFSRIISPRRLPLDRLSQAHVAQMLGNLWTGPIPENLAQKIFRQTEGNPLYVEEIARGLEDDGLVILYDGEWRFPDAEAIRLPQSIHEAIEGRIHYLSADARDVLAQAAVLGETFRLADLVALSDLSEWAVLEHLDVALERQLVQEMSGDATLGFNHAEIHHVLYQDLGTLRRRRLHRRAGETLERRAQPEPERLAEVLARHFSEAGELQKALTYSVAAARQAETLYANEVAVQWYSHALNLLARLDPAEMLQFEAQSLSIHEARVKVLRLMDQYNPVLAC